MTSLNKKPLSAGPVIKKDIETTRQTIAEPDDADMHTEPEE